MLLTAICDEVFPELTNVLKDPNGSTALSIRTQFPTPAALAAASPLALQELRGKAHSLSDAKLKDQEILSRLSAGADPPAPVLYDPDTHRQHRTGQYSPPLSREKPGELIQLPRISSSNE